VTFAPEDLATLAPRERMALRIARFVNESPRVKSATQRFNEIVGSRWMTLVSRARMRLVGMDKMIRLDPDRGVLIAANHRSFFDMYMITTYLHHHVDWVRRMYFPVRSSFFYDRLVGVALNAAMSGVAMYPPIFRPKEKRGVTRAGLDFLADRLREPGTVVGIHPEGTRNKGDDPYELLPAEQGFGRVVLQSMPIVIPVFINGMGNDLYKECRSTFDGTGTPILMVFGDPVDLNEFANKDPERLRTQVEVGRKVLSAIAALGELERSIRGSIAGGATLEDAIASSTTRSSATL